MHKSKTMSDQTKKTKWVKMTVIAFKQVAVEVEDGTNEEMIEQAEQIVVDHPPDSYEIDDFKRPEILSEEPDDKHCRNHDIEKMRWED